MDRNIATATVDEAVDWYLKHRLEKLSPPDRATFAEWLRASPLNVREYLAIAALSNDLPDAADASPAELQTLIERGRRKTSANIVPLSSSPLLARTEGGTRRREGEVSALRRWAVAALAVLLVGGISWHFLTADAFKTAHGEQRTLRLNDGSLLHLNSSSQASVHFSATERVVEVGRGQLMFEVAHDTTRPFRVRAGAVEITAVGTKFDVYRKASETRVTVLEGKVLVRSPQATAEPLELAAGEQALIGPKVTQPRAARVDPQTETAWLQGNIKFFRKPLGEVAGEFNRYGAKPIEIEDSALRDLRVSGVFNAYDTDSFVEFVRRLDGVGVQTEPRRIRILNEPGKPSSAPSPSLPSTPRDPIGAW